jgi:hypothetical protein
MGDKVLLPLSISTIKTVEERVNSMGGRLSCNVVKIQDFLKLLPDNFPDTLLSERGHRYMKKWRLLHTRKGISR